MKTRNLPVVVSIILIVMYTLWFFYDFPTPNKESIVHRLTSADAVEICFYDPDGSDGVVRVHDVRVLTRFSDIFEKSVFISIPDTKCTIFGNAVYSVKGKDVLRVDFCSFPIVLIDGHSYAVSPDFMLLARVLMEKGNKHE